MNRRHFIASLFRAAATAAALAYAPGVLAKVRPEGKWITAAEWLENFDYTPARKWGEMHRVEVTHGRHPKSVTVWYRREKTITLNYADDYFKQLMNLRPDLRRRLLDGDWQA